MRRDFLGVSIDLISMTETVTRVERAMASGTKLHHVALNVSKFVDMQSNIELRRDVIAADIVGIDGIGILIAARQLGLPASERVAGVDLMEQILALCARSGYRPYFLGAKPEVLQTALGNVRKRFPGIEIAGCQHGYFAPDAEPGIVEQIRQSGADCLFIGMPTPRKERFLAAYCRQINVPFVMGVGGGIDVLANLVRRAPRWVQCSGMEWLFRMLQEPRRLWKRYLTSNWAFARIMVRANVARYTKSVWRADP